MPSSADWISWIVLAGFAVALGAWAYAAYRRSPYDPTHSILYFINLLLTRVLWRTEVSGRFDLPPNQGAVIVCNHRSSVDPFFVQLVTGRIVHWMVAAEYFRIPVVGGMLRFMQSIPTRRGGIDTASTREVLRCVSQGDLVGMLPEGRINQTSELLLPVRPGAIMVALRAKVPVIPCYLENAPHDGTFWGCFFMLAHVKMVVGQPIDLSEFHDRATTPELLGELMLRVMREIARLGGQPEFEPQLAGRHWKPKSNGRL